MLLWLGAGDRKKGRDVGILDGVVPLDDGVSLDDGVNLGDGVSLDDGVHLGDGVPIGLGDKESIMQGPFDRRKEASSIWGSGYE